MPRVTTEQATRRRYWLSYDLGLKGAYDSLYAWLDGLNAKECGDSVATFEADVDPDEIGRNLHQLLGNEARIYLVWREDRKMRGKFLLGRRRRSPWTGYAGEIGDPGEEVS